MNVGDAVCWNGECGIIMQIGNPLLYARQIKVEWMVGNQRGITSTWEYVEDVRRMRQVFLDTLGKPQYNCGYETDRLR